MVDEKKVSLMTKIAIYEKYESNRSLRLSRYYETDYVRFNVLKTLVAATVAYWLAIGVYVFMTFDDILVKINEIDYFGIMYKMLGGYVVFCFLYFLFASMVYHYRYQKAKDGLIDYNSNLRDLIEAEGGPMHHGKVVSQRSSRVDNALTTRTTEEKQESRRQTVNRMELLRQREALEAEKKKQTILENVERMNKRNAESTQRQDDEARLREEDRRMIVERRKMLEQQQMDKLRSEREKQGVTRENHNYNSK